MAGANNTDDEKATDPRVAATGAISGTTVAILAVCIPIVAILRSPMVIFFVLGGAAVAIAGVWKFGRSKEEPAKSDQVAALESTIEELKERLENVEVINRYEATLAERELEEISAGSSKRTMGGTRESEE